MVLHIWPHVGEQAHDVHGSSLYEVIRIYVYTYFKFQVGQR